MARPTVITPLTLAGLLQARLDGYSRDQACALIGIDRASLYRAFNALPGLRAIDEMFGEWSLLDQDQGYQSPQTEMLHAYLKMAVRYDTIDWGELLTPLMKLLRPR